MGSCAPAVPRQRRSARWKWSKISAGGDELLERPKCTPQCTAEEAVSELAATRKRRTTCFVGRLERKRRGSRRLEAAAMANGCDEAGLWEIEFLVRVRLYPVPVDRTLRSTGSTVNS